MENGSRKLRVGVVFGGRSGEHEVSLRSAQSVMQALDTNKYEIIPLGITKSGQWLAGDAMLALSSGAASEIEQNGDTQAVILPPSPAEDTLILAANHSTGFDGQLDVVMPVLHGTYGEDGAIQGLFELAGIPYVGSGVVGSAVGMDKAIFKHVMEANGIPVLPWQLVLATDVNKDVDMVAEKLEARLPYPMFVKPANLGSSVGISKCDNRDRLIAGLREAAAYDRRLVVEQGANIRELEISVLGNERPIASVVGEIRPKRDFYDYEAKYITDDSELLIPAPITDEEADEVRRIAMMAYMAIDCAGLARVDLMMDKEDGQLYMNEINTLPGFTSISMYPKLWEASGLAYAELLDRLIELAIDRHKTKSGLRTDFLSE